MEGVNGGRPLPHPLPHPRRSRLSVSVLKQTYLLLIKRTFSIFLFPRYFGVFDGHGGSKVAAYAANNLHRFIVKREEYKENREEDEFKIILDKV